MSLRLVRLPSGLWALVAVPGPQEAPYVVEGEARPLAMAPVEIPALARLSGAALAVPEAA